MKIGMLWFDGNQEEEMQRRIQRACAYYRSKYGQQPNLCLVHPEMIREGDSAGDSAITVQTKATLLPNHFWIGVEEER